MFHQIKKILNNDYTLSVATKVTTALVGVVSSVFSTRYLGVQFKGDYAYVVNIANLLVLILNMGIYQSYSYNYKTIGKSILKKYTDICFLQFFILLIIAVILLISVKDVLTCLIVILVPFNILMTQYQNIVLIERIRLRMFLVAFNSILLAFCYFILWAFASPSIVYVVLLTVAVDVVTVTVYSVGLKVLPRVWEVDPAFLVKVLKFGWIPMLSALFIRINYSVDIIFLKHIGIAEELSFYALAASIISHVWFIPDAFKDVLFSKSARKFDKENLLFSSQICSFFIFVCFLVFLVFGKFLIRVIFGADFVSSYGVTLLLFFGAFSMSIFKLLGIVLISQGRRIVLFISLAVSAIVNIVLNIVLIPRIGMYGAGLASVCSYSICALILLLWFCKLYSVRPLQLMVPDGGAVRFIKLRLKRKPV